MIRRFILSFFIPRMGVCICLHHSPTWVQRHLGGAWSFQLCSLCCGAWKLQRCAENLRVWVRDGSCSMYRKYAELFSRVDGSSRRSVCDAFKDQKTGWYRIASRPKECIRKIVTYCDIHYAGLETAFSHCSNGFRFRNVFEPLLRSWPFLSFLSKRLWSVLVRWC